jgi:hypothetical protein
MFLKSLSRVFILIALTTHSACIYLEASLCNAENRVDVLGLEGNYAFNFYNPYEMEKMIVPLSLLRIEKGRYKKAGMFGDDEVVVETCEIGGVHYMLTPEIFEDQGIKHSVFTVVRLEPFMSESGNRGFQLMQTVSSLSLLKQRQFPHEIVSVPGEGTDEPTAILFLKNKNLDPDIAAQVLDTLSLAITLNPAMSTSGDVAEFATTLSKSQIIQRIKRAHFLRLKL